MRAAARVWLPVRAAWNSISSNSSTPATFTTVPTRPFANRAYTSAISRFPAPWLTQGLTGLPDWPALPPALPAGTFERVPESPAQRMPDFVMQQEVNGQRRPLEQPGLQVRRHPGLPGEHRLEPQRRSVTCY